MSDPQSPREWLLARRRGAAPQLDALRRAALPPESVSAPPAAPTTWRDLLAHIFVPHRAAWRTLALVWIALLAFHFTLGRPPRPSPSATPPPTPEAIGAWLRQFKANETLAQVDR